MSAASGATREARAAEAEAPPTLARGRRVKLRRRGKIFFREVEGPPGAPTLLLLHGWVASAGLNWLHAFAPLGDHFRVIAPDQRGHGRGIRGWRRFRPRLPDVLDRITVQHVEPAPSSVTGVVLPRCVWLHAGAFATPGSNKLTELLEFRRCLGVRILREIIQIAAGIGM